MADEWRPEDSTRAATRAGRRRLARLVTEALAPAPTVALLLVVVGWRSASSAAEGLRWGLLAAIFAALIPFLYILRGMRRRRLTDHHVRVRRQRAGPLAVALGSVLVGWLLLAVWGAPRDLVALVGAMACGLASAALVTLVWKISLHSAVSAGAVTILVLVLGPVSVVLAPFVALVAWARVDLGDHTPAQAVAGVGLGALVAATVFSLLR